MTSRYWCDTLTNYEGTDNGSWSFVGSNKPVRDEYELISEIFHILNYSFIELFHILNYFIYCSIYEIFHISLHD